MKLLALVVGVLVAYFAMFMVAVEVKTRGDGYFAMPLEKRRRFKKIIKAHAFFFRPVFEFVARFYRLKTIPVIRYRDVTGPFMMCSKKSYAATANYQPQPEDIFIATQMKCGTTWTQQIVFEVLQHGNGDLSDEGYRHMYALSPWIETSPTSSVPMDRAPLIGEHKNRIIKTHMPAQLIPHSDQAKYIYVTRHPASCFASCVDFVHFLAGPLAPKREDLLDWFCSDDMFWTSWPDHVESWWQRSQQHDNVLFIHYEEMKKDLPAIVDRVAKFLSVELTETEKEKVVEKAGIEYMRDKEEHFEMFSPNMFTVSKKGGRFMKTGSAERYKDNSAYELEKIKNYCQQKLANASYPLAKFYPELVDQVAQKSVDTK